MTERSMRERARRAGEPGEARDVDPATAAVTSPSRPETTAGPGPSDPRGSR